MKLSDLHDASLIQVIVDWGGGLLSCRLNAKEGHVILEAHSMQKLECPRFNPWGPSVSINEVKTYDIDSGIRITMEMQSGDIIDIICASFNLIPTVV
jgi:galactose mutarotase-like enzyme